MSRLTHISVRVGFCQLRLGADGATLDYKVRVAVLPPPTVNPSAPNTHNYEAGDLWTCSQDNTHYFWSGTEWVRWTGDEQHHPSNEGVILYQGSNGSVKWKVVAE